MIICKNSFSEFISQSKLKKKKNKQKQLGIAYSGNSLFIDKQIWENVRCILNVCVDFIFAMELLTQLILIFIWLNH